MRISIVAGARPNFVKVAPLVREFRAAGARVRIIHTGQHYDANMSVLFFEQLRIPLPDINLGVGSGSHVLQIAEVMRRLEPELLEHPPEALVVVGDVNSTFAAALAGQKLGCRIAHVEAGLRSFDRSMPEEINRTLTDSLSEWLFTSELAASDNLLREGISAQRVRLVGNVMIDSLQEHLPNARALRIPEQFGLSPSAYAVLTVHRPENVDAPERLESILEAAGELARDVPVVFPVHPRTRERIREFGLEDILNGSGIIRVEPQGYLSMLGLLDQARIVLTDSGGIQDETTALRVPCLTLRESTERPVTVSVGSNRLVGTRKHEIGLAVRQALRGPHRLGRVPEAWDGGAAKRIAAAIREELTQATPVDRRSLTIARDQERTSLVSPVR